MAFWSSELAEDTSAHAGIDPGSYLSHVEINKIVSVEGDIVNLELPLPSGRISGAILNAKGDPVGREARLTCLARADGQKPPRRVQRFFEDGRMVFEHLIDGRYRVELMNADSALSALEPLEIREGAAIDGVVLREEP